MLAGRMAEPRPTLSVSLIARNEEQFLGGLLGAVTTFADEIVVADTGSTDATRDVAAAHGARVVDVPWCDDFAKARNASLGHCTKDFVMWLDADDIIEPDSAARLKAMFSRPVGWDVLYLPYHGVTGGRLAKRRMPPRIWRNHLGVQWLWPVHEQLSFPEGMNKRKKTLDIRLLHHPLRQLSANSDRNLRILKQALRSPEYRGSPHILWQLAQEFAALANPRQSAAHYEQAVAACDKADRYTLARLYAGLARQYRLLDDPHAALKAAGGAAAAFPAWREPYCAMAESYFRLGDADAGEACLALAEAIAIPERQVEDRALYEPPSFQRFAAAARAVVPVPPAPRRDARTVRLVAGGDVCLARQLPGLVDRYGPLRPFRDIAARLKSADVTLVNLETCTTTLGDFFKKQGRRPYFYRNRPEVLDVLLQAGVNVVTVGNNHAMDFGADALEQQLEILDACGVAACGGGRDYMAALRPAYISAGGLTLAFIGVDTETPATQATETTAGVNYAVEAELLKSIAASLAEARCHADLVIVTPHWGANWVENAPEHRRTLARRMIDLGVDAILGHSAHILQGIEVYRDRPIVYDMGSLLFDRVGENRLADSALFELEMTAAGVHRLTVTPIRLLKGRAHFAEEPDRTCILDLLSRLTRELDPAAAFERSDERLEFALSPTPRAIPTLPLAATQVHRTRPIDRVPTVYRTMKSNVLYDVVPAGCAFEPGVVVNPQIEVLGARIGSPVRPGRGFLCEVFIRVARPPQGRWEARLTGRNEKGDSFVYTHPIADGIWPPSRWRNEDLIGDRIVVRPPTNLPEGIYRLFWQLLDQETGKTMPATQSQPRLVDGAVEIGQVVVSPKAPGGVAGINGAD